MKNLLICIIAISFSFALHGQSLELIEKKVSLDIVVSGGSITILDPSDENISYISNIGSFESSKGYFFETGVELKTTLKKNSIKTGLYYGYSNATIEGSIPIMNNSTFIICGPFFPNPEDIPTESFEAEVHMHRFSVPLSFIKESRNNNSFAIDHEFGVIVDVKIESNFADVERDIMNIPRFLGIHPSELDSESNFTIPKNLGIRFLYGVSASISPKITVASNFKFGMFDTYAIDANASSLSSWYVTEEYNNFDRPVIGYFEMGFGLKYKLK